MSASTLYLTRADVGGLCVQGPVDLAAADLAASCGLAKLLGGSPEVRLEVQGYLRETGAWDKEELAACDPATLAERVLFVAASQLEEEGAAYVGGDLWLELREKTDEGED